MIFSVLVTFVDLVTLAYTVLITIRVFMSFVPAAAESGFGRLIHELTEPLLAPIRKILPQSSLLDFSPLVALVLLRLLQWGLHSIFN